jgi:putative nucleotidyltransferase with HDIG domain
MNAHVLVVDGEAGVRELLATWLETAGYTCTQACDAAHALTLLADQSADIALLDVSMPGQDGLSLARQLRDRHHDMAIILVTGLQGFDLAAEGMRLGLRDYLLKPFSRPELLDSVRRAMEWRASLQKDRAASLALQMEIDVRRRALTDAFQTLESCSTSALQALLIAETRRNPARAAHAVRVARLAVELATALGVDAVMTAHIERGALLHDIGKIALPETLMCKPGPLSEEEISTIRTHAQIGFEIVSAAPALITAAEIVLASHEAFDGTGYPHGLAGHAIPLGSRIVAVVDTFDALTWGRVHQDPVSRARAAADLVRSAGTQFDPDIVRAWLRVAEWEQPDQYESTSAFSGLETSTSTRS